jgi:hypothetical protein
VILLVIIEDIILWVKVAEYVGGYHFGLQLLCQVLIYHWLLRVACVLLTACEGALESTLLVKAP